MTSRTWLSLLCAPLCACPIFAGGEAPASRGSDGAGGAEITAGSGGGGTSGGEGGAPFGAPAVDVFCEDVIEASWGDSTTVATFGYDAAGNLLRYSEVDADGVVAYELTRAYDSAGRRAGQEVWIHAGEGERRSMTWSYDDADRVVGTTFQETLPTGTSLESVEYTYDTMGRYLEIESWLDGAPDAVSMYEWVDGEPLRLTTRFEEDGPNGPSYHYELVDGRWLGLLEHRTAGFLDSRSVFTYGAEGELVRSDYDSDGDGDFDQISTLEWDAEHHPIRYGYDLGADGTEDGVERLRFDREGRLIERVRTQYDASGVAVVSSTMTSAYWLEGGLYRVDVRDGETLELQRVWMFHHGCEGDPSKDIRYGDVRAWSNAFVLPFESVDSSDWWLSPELF